MDDIYALLRKEFSKIANVVVTSGKGAQGIKYNKKMFAMFYKGDLTLQFSPQRVDELTSSGLALPHDPGTGKPLKDRVLVPATNKREWLKLCKESLEYVKSKN